MAQPTAYNVTTDFSVYQASNPTDPLTGSDIDTEFNNIETTLDETLTNLALIQRDDGELANATVGQDQLKTEIYAGINPPAAWAASTAYSLRNSVIDGTKWYYCNTAHTSQAALSDDAAKWTEIIDFADLNAAASVKLAMSANDTTPDYFSALFKNDSMIQTKITDASGDEKARAGITFSSEVTASNTAGAHDVAGTAHHVNTSGGAVTRYLDDAPSDKDTFWYIDLEGNWQANNVTFNGNGKNINYRGLGAAATLTADTNFLMVMFRFDAGADEYVGVGYA
jgi:hypothetical protein